MHEPPSLELNAEHLQALQDLLHEDAREPAALTRKLGLDPDDLARGVVRYVLSTEYDNDFDQVLRELGPNAGQILRAAQEVQLASGQSSIVKELLAKLGRTSLSDGHHRKSAEPQPAERPDFRMLPRRKQRQREQVGALVRNRGFRKAVAVFAAALAAMVVIALCSYYLQPALYPPLPPTLIVLRIDEYRDPRIPVSPWSAQDRRGLRALRLPEKNVFISQEKQLLAQELQNLDKQQSAAQPLVVYLGAYAVVRDDGAVALLPADARLDDPATWLPVKDVLAALQQCPVRRRLLLLDLAQPCVVPHAGVLAADVVERLKPLLEAAVKDDPNLQILTACAPGQVSHASEELGHSVFAHYLIQGLSGRAGGSLAAEKADGRVTVRELAEYVKTRVDRWADLNLGARQTPEFFGSGADYELVSVVGGQPPPTEPLSREYLPALLDGWVERDRWWDDRETRTPPQLYLQLHHALLHAEERWRAGAAAAEVEDRLKSALAEVRQQLAKEVGPAERGSPRSLAQAVARGQKASAPLRSETLRQFNVLGDQAVRASSPKATEQGALRRGARGVSQEIRGQAL